MSELPRCAHNPFQARIRPNWFFDAFRLLIASPLILLRLVLVVLVLCVARCFACCNLQLPIRLCFRAVFFVSGFFWVEKTDQRTRQQKNQHCRVIVANHVGYFDIWSLVAYYGCSVVAEEGTFKIPLLGPCLSALGGISVNRRCSTSRERAKKEIEARVSEFGSPPLLVFVEGCTSHDRVLCQFRHGAFLTAAAVLPIYISYPNCFVDFYHGRGGGSGVGTLLLQLSQVFNRQHLLVLEPKSSPSGIKHDPGAFAKSVRAQMSEAVQPPLLMTDHSFLDVQLHIAARRHNINPPDFTVQAAKDALGVDLKRLLELMEVFVSTNYPNEKVFGDFVQAQVAQAST